VAIRLGSRSNMKPLFWIDLEMTGLDEKTDSILEVAIVITDINFIKLEEYHRIVFQPKEVLDTMNDWCKKTHGDSGLTAAVPKGTPLAKVEEEVTALILKHYGAKEKVVLCGNSVGNDKRFVDQYMPKVAERLHYRLIDVSSFKEIFREKYKVNFNKENSHRALDDVYQSIRELSYYLSFVNVSNQAQPTH
jgi:oligoribonuclease